MVTFNDDEIEAFIRMPKTYDGTRQGLPELREKQGHSEAQAGFRGSDGTEFRVLLRRSLVNPMAFSAILMVRVPGLTRWFRLRRYNGNHWHRNRIEGNRFKDFHIHTATERYQRAGRREDAFAEATDRFSNYEGAVACLQHDTALSTGPDYGKDQLGLKLEDSA